MKAIRQFFYLALMLPFFACADVYKWTDENGKIHFTDKKPDGDKSVEVARNLEGKYSENSPDLSFSVVRDPKFIDVKDITRILSWEPKSEGMGVTTVAVKYQYDGYQGADGIYLGVVASKNGWPSPESSYEPKKVNVGVNTVEVRFYWRPEKKNQMCPEDILITIYRNKETIHESTVHYGECLAEFSNKNNRGYEISKGVK